MPIIVYIYVQSGEYSLSQYTMNSSLLFIMSANTIATRNGTSHTTPISCINQGPMLLKLIGWRHCPFFRWVTYILGTTTQTPGAGPGRTVRYYSNSITVIVWDVSHPQELCSGTLSRLRSLYPRSTQKTDVVSSIISPIPV